MTTSTASLTPFSLRQLSTLYPNPESVLSRLASLNATMTLSSPTIHVISDIHGEFKKLRHIINNGSGTLLRLLSETFEKRLSAEELKTLLNFIHYPREAFTLYQTSAPDSGMVLKILGWQLEVLRRLSTRYPLEKVEQTLPDEHKELFRELLFAPQLLRSDAYTHSMLKTFIDAGRGLELLRITARAIRNSLISELVIAGDLGDRGPRIDRVISYLMRQPRVSMTWGNHDATWMGACLGHDACIATVLRISLRYRRLSQLEEGYGITMAPLEKLAREVYANDPAEHFKSKGEGLREKELLQKMQKAIAIIQFKLEGQLIERNPSFAMEDRNLLHTIDIKTGTVTIGDKIYPLQDTLFPTINWERPYELSTEESACLERLRQSFLQSSVLWDHMQYVLRSGAMYLVRDNHLIFHACVPVDERGQFLSFEIAGVAYSGKALFDKLGEVVARAFRHPVSENLDILWYLWAGPRSPWFGKDKMATFETYFVSEPATHKESKNPYFKLIHDKDFCETVLREFGVDSKSGMIVNGHVPVKIAEGESPLKQSGMAVTIDGAFSEAYGDKGFTLILDSTGSYLAQHHHFESIENSILQGGDIVPTITALKNYPSERLYAEAEEGHAIASEIQALNELIQAYDRNLLAAEH